jgi:hypothetical protein
MDNDLCLREVRLLSPEPCVNLGEGLWFVFPNGGAGEFVSGHVRQRLSPKALLVANVERVGTSICSTTPEFRFQCFKIGLETLFLLLPCAEIPRLRAAADIFKTGKMYLAAREPATQCIAMLERVPTTHNLEHRALLLRVVAVLLEHELEAVKGKQLPAANADERVRQILDAISTTELMNASVDDLAHKLGTVGGI